MICGYPAVIIDKYFLGLIKYYTIVISISSIIGYFLFSTGRASWEPMYNSNNYTYLERPFGIFGQPSVNTCLLCFFYLFYVALYKRINEYKGFWNILFWLVVTGIILQGSGTGYFCLIFVIYIELINASKKIRKNSFLFISIIIAIVFQILFSSNISKFNIEELKSLYSFVLEEIWYPYLKIANSTSDILWGIEDFPLSIDLGPIFMIGTVGVVGFLYMTFFLFSLLRETKVKEMKIGLIILMIGNLHYPVMFYAIMHFMWFYILYFILVIEKRDLIIETKKCKKYAI